MACIETYKIEEYIHTNGNDTYIYDGRIWTYQAKRNNETPTPYDEKVFISYNGSNVVNGVDFSGPTYVIIPAGGISVSFEIYMYITDTTDNRIIQISGESSTSPSCVAVTNIIIGDIHGDYIQASENGTCCEFFDKNYEVWTKTEDKTFYCEDFFYDTPMLY